MALSVAIGYWTMVAYVRRHWQMNEPSRRVRPALVAVELVGHARGQRAPQYRHVLGVRMAMGREAEVGRQPDADDERPWLPGIAVNNRELRAGSTDTICASEGTAPIGATRMRIGVLQL
jgi:hypothetical protein